MTCPDCGGPVSIEENEEIFSTCDLLGNWTERGRVRYQMVKCERCIHMDPSHYLQCYEKAHEAD